MGNDAKIQLIQPTTPWETRWYQGRLEHLGLRDLNDDNAVDPSPGGSEIDADRIVDGVGALQRVLGNGPLALDALAGLEVNRLSLSIPELADVALAAGPARRADGTVNQASVHAKATARATHELLMALVDLQADAKKAELTRQHGLDHPSFANQFLADSGAQAKVGKIQNHLFGQLVHLADRGEDVANNEEFSHANLDRVRAWCQELTELGPLVARLVDQPWVTRDQPRVDAVNEALVRLSDEVAPFFGTTFPALEITSTEMEDGGWQTRVIGRATECPSSPARSRTRSRATASS